MAVTKLDVQAVKDLMAKSPWMSYVDAARQVRGTPTPTTTPTNPPAQLTEQEVRQWMTGLSVPERQQMRADLKPVTEPNKTVITPIAERPPETPTTTPATPKAPEPVTPVVPSTPTPEVKPTIPKPVTPTTPTVKSEVKKESPIVPVSNRETEIQTNLANGYNNDPSLFTDRTAFDKAYNYSTKPPEEQAILDSFFKSKQPTINSIYTQLTSWQDIPQNVKDTPSYRVANLRYNKVKLFSGMTQTELKDALTKGDIVEWSQQWEDLKVSNPELTTKALNLFKVNGGKTNIFTKNADWTTTNNLEKNATDDWVTTFKDMFKVQSLEEIRNAVQTEDFKAAQWKANEYAMQLNELQDALDAVDDEVDAEYKWTGATSSYIRMKKADRKEALNKEYDSINRKYTTQFNIANQILTQNTANLATQQKQQDLQNQALLSYYQTQMQNENALKLDQAKFEQGLAQQAQMAKDPVTWVKSILATYAQMGITPMRSEAQIIADIENQVAQGIPVEQALTDLNKAFQSKPEYKQYMDYKKAQMTPTAKTPEVKNFGTSDRPDYRQYNTSTGQWETVTQGGYIDVPRTWNNVWQDTNNPWNIMWDTEAQRNIATSYGAVWFYKSPNGRTYAVFPDMQTWVNASLSDLQSKLSGWSSWATPDTTLAKFASGWVSWPNAPMNQNAVNNYVKLTGYSANTKIKDIPMDILAKAIFSNEGVDISKSATISPTTQQSQQVTWRQFSDSDIALLSSVTKLDKQGKQTLADNWFTERDWSNFNAGLLPPTSMQKEDAQAVVNKIDNILNSDWTNAVGTWKWLPVPWTDRTVVEKKVNALVDSLAITNLDKLKWPMSDKDIAFLKNTATYLSTDLSEEEFKNTIDEIKKTYLKIVWWTPKTSLSQPTQINTWAWTNTVTWKTTYTW